MSRWQQSIKYFSIIQLSGVNYSLHKMFLHKGLICRLKCDPVNTCQVDKTFPLTHEYFSLHLQYIYLLFYLKFLTNEGSEVIHLNSKVIRLKEAVTWDGL